MEHSNEFVEQLYDLYFLKLRSYCLRLIRGNDQYAADVDDCILEVLYTAHLKQNLLCSHQCIEGWLKKACYFRIVSLARKENKSGALKTCGLTTLSPDSLLLAYDPFREYMEIQENKERLSALLQTFSDKDVKLIYEYWYRRTPIIDIAKQRNTTIGTIKNRLNRIRKKALREYTLHYKGKLNQ